MTENRTGLIVAAPQFHRPGQTLSTLNGRGQFPPLCRIGDDQGYTTGIRLWLSRKWPVTACRTDQHLISASPSPTFSCLSAFGSRPGHNGGHLGNECSPPDPSSDLSPFQATSKLALRSAMSSGGERYGD
jgi:hypothetical protein